MQLLPVWVNVVSATTKHLCFTYQQERCNSNAAPQNNCLRSQRNSHGKCPHHYAVAYEQRTVDPNANIALINAAKNKITLNQENRDSDMYSPIYFSAPLTVISKYFSTTCTRNGESPCRSTQEESDKMYTPWDPCIHNNDTTTLFNQLPFCFPSMYESWLA